MKALVLTFLCAVMMGCAPIAVATHHPLPDVPFAVVSTADRSLAGPVLSENDSTITIAAYGVAQTFEKSMVKSIERDTVSNPTTVQQETLEHSATASGSSTALLVLNLIGIVVALALSQSH